ncbi:MAG: DUF2236 domain-containing protein [Gammaproteobacteria bacterium]|nr:DUF2236 domain-containing protein [Gammaproteobacteria bacterium]MYF27816.1 DUF2236 domain-containing protein [Gammaproteobacteria bacterium]
MDPIMVEIADLNPGDLHRFIRAGIEGLSKDLRAAPQVLREFFDAEAGAPPWADYASHEPAERAFAQNVESVLVAFVCGVLVEGFSTLIATSFATTGRVLDREPGRRRLMQNNRHLLEAFCPGGMRPDGDGWKLSMRIRFVHARVRQLLAVSGCWDEGRLGVPLHAAHLGFAIAAFSDRLLKHASLVGAAFDYDAQASVMAVWRLVGKVMGVPDGMLFADREDAQRIFGIGQLCEPPPGPDSVAMANGLIEGAPAVAGFTDASSQQAMRMRKLAYRISRALIGNELAERLEFPRMPTAGVLLGFRTKQWTKRLIRGDRRLRAKNLTNLMAISAYDGPNATYRMPDHYRSSESTPW